MQSEYDFTKRKTKQNLLAILAVEKPAEISFSGTLKPRTSFNHTVLQLYDGNSFDKFQPFITQICTFTAALCCNWLKD